MPGLGRVVYNFWLLAPTKSNKMISTATAMPVALYRFAFRPSQPRTCHSVPDAPMFGDGDSSRDDRIRTSEWTYGLPPAPPSSKDRTPVQRQRFSKPPVTRGGTMAEVAQKLFFISAMFMIGYSIMHVH